MRFSRTSVPEAPRASGIPARPRTWTAAPATAPPDAAGAVQLPSGPGSPLPASERVFFEQRFGHDLSRIRIHTGGDAQQAARTLGARAFTLGQDIAFAPGQYRPGTADGRWLLAHELAHTRQAERGHAPVIRRALTDDFRIRDISPEDAANPSMIFFQVGSSSIPASEQSKIAALASPAGQDLTLNGFASEEGSAASNDAEIQARLNAVSAALTAAGHTGLKRPVNLRTSGLGQINYRHMRAVEVLPTPVGMAAAPSTVSPCSAPGSQNAPCGTAFVSSWPIAHAAMTTAQARLANAADAGANTLLATLFSGVPRPTVVANIKALARQVAALPTQHQCHSDCDAGCGRPAYNTGSGIGPGGAMMTLCPDFLGSADANWRARILIHESAHGTAGLTARDIAYANTRQVAFLVPADAVRNTDSYVLLAWLLAFPGSINIGPTTPDTLNGMTAAEQNTARRAVAWVESWLNYCDFDTEQLYGTVHRAVPPAPAWDVSQPGDRFNVETMHRLAPIFGLTDPGVAAPFAQPTVEEKWKIAAIHDRYDQMYSAVNWQVLTVTKGPAGSDAWGGRGAALPRLTQTVTVGPAFFGMSPADAVKHLILLMATGMSGISAGFRQKYVDAADQIRQHRGLGP